MNENDKNNNNNNPNEDETNLTSNNDHHRPADQRPGGPFSWRPVPEDQPSERTGRRIFKNGQDLLQPGTLKTSRSLSMIVGSRRTPSPATPTQPSNFRSRRECVPRLHLQYSMPSSLNSKRDSKNPYELHHSILDERIINCQLSIAAKKDFREEVRALVDVRKFVSDSFILTDITEVRIGAIVELIVDRLVDCRELDDEVACEAKSLLFVEQNSLSMLLANTMQGLYKSRVDGRLAYDNTWIVATGNLSSLHKRQVAIARFPQPVNFGRQSQEVRFLIIVLAPNKEKLTKSAWETGRTFATMFTDINFRRRLLRAKTQDEFKMELLTRAESLAQESEINNNMNELFVSSHENGQQVSLNSIGKRGLTDVIQFDSCAAALEQKPLKPNELGCCSGLFGSIGSGLIDDLKRRLSFYISDFSDGIFGDRSLYKSISTIIFLYFSVLLPCIAFGVVDHNNTEGQIDPKKTMIGQAVGGLFFAIFSGQPLIVIMTTAPLCIYVKVIFQISQDLEVDFGSFYACVGLWMCFFLVLMSLTNSSNLIRYCTRSTEDIFALFTAFAFGFDGIKEAIRSFNKYYWEPDCTTHGTVLLSRTIPELASSALMSASHNLSNGNHLTSLFVSGSKNMTPSAIHVQATYTTSPLAADLTDHLQHNNAPEHSDILQHSDLGTTSRCQRETCILFLFLMCGTLWLANSFSSFNKTPYLSSRKREVIKDYALAISVLIFSFVGSYLFSDIRLDVFEFNEFTGLQFAQLNQLSMKAMAVSCLLGCMLSVLFFIDQNICGAMVNNAPYKLKKGDYFHLDLLILAALNSLLSLTGLPWMHGKLPHSHLHSKALADYEERVDEGHVHQTIVNIRETRITTLICSLLVGLSLLAIPYPLSYVPLPVLSGVFLYTALSELKSNSLVERICLLFREQAAYPPNHYIRRCPQRKIHFFTFAQIAQLAVVTFIGFYPNPYVNMAFPIVVATFVPIRDKLLPRLIDSKYLSSLDSPSTE